GRRGRGVRNVRRAGATNEAIRERRSAMSEATAIAHPNIALSKYWGKRDGGGNLPAVPSLSVTLDALRTTTRVRFDETFTHDRVVLGAGEADPTARGRVIELLDRVRAAAGDGRRAEVRSRNDFPTSSGLASSASGFAALAIAAAGALGLDWDAARLSDLARRSSASAARSVYGGFVELDAGPSGAPPETTLSARPVAARDHFSFAVTICVTTEAPKAISSREGMRVTMARSPYARAWLDEAPRTHAHLRDALLARDFARVGELAEASTFAMHASAIAAGVIYWTGATVEAIAAVSALREAGTLAYASIDAGPHVKVLSRREDAPRVRGAIDAVPGVTRTILAHPGEGARLALGAEFAEGLS
ncbi:MAG: diphosphomevalonate decarboxylase, partial [Polyangiaceae bacterium]